MDPDNRCHVRLGTPYFGDPGSPISYEIGDPGPQVNIVLGTPGAQFSYAIGDPLMKIGTPMHDFRTDVLIR